MRNGTHFHLKSDRRIEDRYRALAGGRWTGRLLGDSLTLLRAHLAAPDLVVPQVPGTHVREFMALLNSPALPAVPSRLPDRGGARARHARRVAEAAFLLTLQSRARLMGAADLFRDAQSLLFHGCVLFELDALERLRMPEERDYLLNALYMHTLVAWEGDRRQQAHMQGLLLEHVEHIGASKPALDAMWSAFRGTPPDDHDYLSRAQAVWSRLLEDGRPADAEAFALGLHRAALAEHLPEVRDMLRITHARMARRAPAGRTAGAGGI